MGTTRELDKELLQILAGRGLTNDELEDLLLARGLQMVSDELMALALDGLIKLFVDDRGSICVMGAEGEPIKLSELIKKSLLDEAVSVFGDDGSYEEGDYDESEGHTETVLH